MTKRILVLPISALIIAGLCAYKLTRPSEPAARNQPVVMKRQAPLFKLFDQREPPKLKKIDLEHYLGRHWIVLVFFDPDRELAGNEVLVWLKEHTEELDSRNVEVFAISPALPQTHRKMLKAFADKDEPVPFQMLSDLDGKVHRLYGMSSSRSERHGASRRSSLKFRPGVFLIDRAGRVAWEQEKPRPLDDPLPALQREFGLE